VRPCHVRLLLAEHGMQALHPLADLNMLWAECLTIQALATVAGALFRAQMIVAPAPFLECVEHDGVIEDVEQLRDVQAVGAGHAVGALCAGDGAQALIGVAGPGDQAVQQVKIDVVGLQLLPPTILTNCDFGRIVLARCRQEVDSFMPEPVSAYRPP
jgi:hypothetical protein